MPRPKVRPETRRRVQHACLQCKASKRKCDAAVPCSYCVKRGRADECNYSETTPTKIYSSLGRRTTIRSSGSGVPPAEEEYSHTASGISEAQQSYHEPVLRDDEQSEPAGRNHDLDLGSPSTTRSRMLNRNRGEQVYVGKAASLSFLQLIREVVARCIGPSELSVNPEKDQMLEVDLGLNTTAGDYQVFDIDQVQQCVDQYFLATAGLLHVLTDSEVAELVRVTQENESDLVALRLVVIAIGAQVLCISGVYTALPERNAFAQARRIAFEDMLENPTLNMIRLFLLMSFYMLGACRRNAAFMYLGVAARAAHALGLHTAESYENLATSQRDARLRCWKSLVSLDLMVSSILGRNAVTLPPRNMDKAFRIIDEPAEDSNAELEAIYRLALLVDLIASRINGPDNITAEGAMGHLKALTSWSSTLPAFLRPSNISEPFTPRMRQSIVGSLHVSCFYYFTVMLVTRPFFILHATHLLAHKHNQTNNNYTSNLSEDVQELSSSCLNAATYMAQTCMDVMQFSLLGENMVILQAWIFAAGLVLGFHIFAFDNSSKVTGDAFVACQDVLSMLAIRSPQSAQYREILMQFSTAIKKHRDLSQLRRHKHVTPLVERIMSLRSDRSTEYINTPNSYETGLSPLQSSNIGRNATAGLTSSHDMNGMDYMADNILPGQDTSLWLSGDWLNTDLADFGAMAWDTL